MDFTEEEELEGYKPYRDASLQGPSYWKAPQLNWPHVAEKEMLMADPRSYDETSYNEYQRLFDPATPASEMATFDPSFKGSYATISTYTAEQRIAFGMRLSIPDDMQRLDSTDERCNLPLYNCGPKHISEVKQINQVTYQPNVVQGEGVGSAEDDRESQVWMDWHDGKGLLLGEAAKNRSWSRYWKTVPTGHYWPAYEARPISEEEAPARLRQLDYAASLKGPFENAKEPPTSAEPTNDPDMFCWACQGILIDSCDPTVYEVTQEDGATTQYRWYRWRDQPALRSMKVEFPLSYTEEILNAMQQKIEWMHEHWPVVGDWRIGQPAPSKTFLKRPASVPNMAMIEEALIVSPPSHVPQKGWVPIPIGLTYPDLPTTFKQGVTPRKGCRRDTQIAQTDGLCY